MVLVTDETVGASNALLPARAGNPQQVGRCGVGEACLLYTWKKSRTETGQG